MKKIHAVVWKEDSWYVAKALELGVASQGKTEKSALSNLKEAIELYLEDEDYDELSVQVDSPKLQDLTIQVHA